MELTKCKTKQTYLIFTQSVLKLKTRNVHVWGTGLSEIFHGLLSIGYSSYIRIVKELSGNEHSE